MTPSAITRYLFMVIFPLACQCDFDSYISLYGIVFRVLLVAGFDSVVLGVPEVKMSSPEWGFQIFPKPLLSY